MPPRVHLEDLAGCELILGSSEQWDFYRWLVTDIFSERGLVVHTTLEASNTLGILGLVGAGLGVSIYPECLRRLAPACVAMRGMDGCDRRIETVLARRRDRNDEALANFVACCRREFGR